MHLASIVSRFCFKTIKDNGKAVSTKGFLLQMLPTSTKWLKPNQIRTGLIVTKRLGNAVVRNRIKRRLRALTRQILLKHGKPGCDYVFIARHDCDKREFAMLKKDLIYALHQLQCYQQSEAQ